MLLIAAESARLDTMVRLFGVAVLLVSPAAFLVVRRILRSRRPAPDALPTAPTPDESSPVDPLVALVAAVDEVAARGEASGDPDGAVVAVPAALVARLHPDSPRRDDTLALVVDDAARRGGLAARWKGPADGSAPAELHLVTRSTGGRSGGASG